MKALFFLLVIACCGMVYGQGNLQFNRVINYTLTADIPTQTNTYDTVVFCVPNNKVWKIESAFVGWGEVMLLSQATKNYSSVASAQRTVTLCPVNTGYDVFPLWLESNYCGRFQWNFGTANQTCNNGCYTGLISILEFNIVP
ncbi:MAG: hypothetical protein EBU82_10375 [Flavobacteriia bacterium]|jgi:hypothetical protein|nr:hypothetical protein [Flavobacteriia bacterium]